MHRKRICRTGFAGRRGARGDPLANRFDELDTLMLLDNVFIPCEVPSILPIHPRSDLHSRTFHHYSMFEDVCRAGGVYSERVSGQRDLPAAIEHSLTLRHTENAPRAPQHYLPCLAPKRTCSRLLLQLTLCFGQP